jgi:hypothetical protein
MVNCRHAIICWAKQLWSVKYRWLIRIGCMHLLHRAGWQSTEQPSMPFGKVSATCIGFGWTVPVKQRGYVWLGARHLPISESIILADSIGTVGFTATAAHRRVLSFFLTAFVERRCTTCVGPHVRGMRIRDLLPEKMDRLVQLKKEPSLAALHIGGCTVVITNSPASSTGFVSDVYLTECIKTD